MAIVMNQQYDVLAYGEKGNDKHEDNLTARQIGLKKVGRWNGRQNIKV